MLDLYPIETAEILTVFVPAIAIGLVMVSVNVVKIRRDRKR